MIYLYCIMEKFYYKGKCDNWNLKYSWVLDKLLLSNVNFKIEKYNF